MHNELWFLIVDDHPIVGQGLVSNFQARGHRARTVTDPTLVLEWMDNNKYDVVILDLGLGAESQGGLTLLQNIRASKRHGKVPVFMFSAEGHREEVIAQCLAHGANGCFSKEEIFGDLFYKLMEALRQTGGERMNALSLLGTG